MKRLAIAAFALTMAGINSQASKPEHINIPKIAPRTEDVSSIEGMIKAWYDIVNVKKGEMPDWGRDHTLYIDDLRFIEIHQRHGQPVPEILSHQQYVDNASPLAKGGFSEREIHRVTERFGDMAHVWSTYESRRTPEGPVIARGINSIELFWDGKRWWIANAVFEDETDDKRIPKEYLP